jgi:hypothetical protein
MIQSWDHTLCSLSRSRLMLPSLRSYFGSRTLVSFAFRAGLADGKTSREYMEAERNLLLHESHFPGFQVPLPLTR